MRWSTLICCALLTGCAWQSSVLQMDQNRFQVSANASPARGAATGARDMALTKAGDYCKSSGKTISVENIETQYAFPANAVATVTFSCK